MQNGLTDGGQLDWVHGRYRDIIEADEGDIVWYPQPGIQHGVHGSYGDNVRGSENRIRFNSPATFHGGIAAWLGEIAFHDQGLIDRPTGILERLLIPLQPIDGGRRRSPVIVATRW